MASIAKRDDGQWRARYRDAAGKEHAPHFARKVDARRWLDELTADIVTGRYVDPAGGRQTLREYAEAWRAVQVHRPTTQAHVETMLRLHIYPSLGDRPLASIRPSDIHTLVKLQSLNLQPSTVRVAHRYLAGIMKAAVRDRLIASSPCAGTRLPKSDPSRVEPLSLVAVRATEAAVPDRYRAMVTLGAGAGLRQGEAFGLTVDRVDFLRRTLTVNRQLVTIAKRAPYLAPPKTAASVRVIPLPQVVVDALAAHLKAYPAGADGLVFTSEGGRPLRRQHFSARAWRPAVVAAEGVPAGTRFHDLRHFYASLLIRHGESVKTVQARLGHASASETLDTYSHLWPDSDDRTRAAVDVVLGTSPAGQAAAT